jgi:drug/metabolite transporter (DMT)-like permease
MLWIPITIWAAFAQTVRNAAQRHLTAELGTLGATLVRFLYGLPFAGLWLLAVQMSTGHAAPGWGRWFVGWLVIGAVSQILATALLLRTMQDRNFALGVAYSKTEVIQVAIFALVFLGDPIDVQTAAAVLTGTMGVLLLSPGSAALLTGWTSRSALLGLASGMCFAMSAVGYAARRSRSIRRHSCWRPLIRFSLPSFCRPSCCGWLLVRSPSVVARVRRAWRMSLFAGFMGAAASAGWFTAFALEPVAHVRTLGLVELIFSYAVSRRIFRERIERRELAGIALLALGVIIITLR